MADTANLDTEAAHRFFAVDCFNKTWDLIEKSDRTPAEDRLMVALTHASIYHWSQRSDCRDRNLSIGYWQASRVHALLGNAAEARRLAEVCLSFSADLEPFFLGYAHEALARALLVAGDTAAAMEHKRAALAAAERIDKREDRAVLVADLEALETGSTPP